MSVTLEHEVVTRTRHPITFTEKELIWELYKSWLSSKKCQDGCETFTPECVNDCDQYEYWHYAGHGTGITYTQDIPECDVLEYQAFQTLLKIWE